MPSIIVVIVALIGIGYILKSAGGGYVDTASGIAPRSDNPTTNALALAIAHAEGFYVPGARAARNHNPGDITDTYLSVGRDGPLSVFPDDQTGWDALTHKLDNILAGNSTVYPLSFTIAQLAHEWTGGDQEQSWASNVVSVLRQHGVQTGDGLGTDTQLSDIVNA